MRYYRKGQITIFVILALVLLIGAGLIFYFLYTKEKPPSQTIVKLGQEFEPVQQTIDNCITTIGKDAIVQLGKHGGYINPIEGRYTGLSFDYDELDPTESDLIFIDPTDNNSSIVYWQYARSNSNCWHCTVNSLTPSIAYMQAQLANYLAKNLPDCLNNLDALKEKGFDIRGLGNISVISTIREEDVNFLVNYSIEITKASTTTRIDLFSQDIPIPLKKYYDIAINITSNQVRNEFLDAFSYYLITQYSGMNSEKFPPFSTYSQENNLILWSKTQLKNNFEDLLWSYLGMLRINGTQNGQPINIAATNPVERSFYRAMLLDIIDKKHKDSYDLKNIEINFLYIGQQTYFDIRPNDGDLVGPLTGAPGAGLLSSVPPDQMYKFFYDISYPVIVEIRDKGSQEDYSFMFALQSNIKENKFMSQWLRGQGTLSWSNDIVKMSVSDPTSGQKMFDPVTQRNYTNTPQKISKIMFCDPAQENTGDITLKTYDASNMKPLDGVSLTYICGSYAGCYKGQAKYNKSINASSITTNLPLCLNGYIYLEKSGYLSKKIPLTTQKGLERNLGSIYLEKVFTKNVSVNKYVLTRNMKNIGMQSVFLGNSISANKTKLGADDMVIVTFTLIQDGKLVEPYNKVMVLGKNSAYNSTTIDLVPGKYIVKAQLLDYKGVEVPKECQEICVDYILFVCTEYKKIPENPVPIKPAMWGGVEFTNATPYIVSRYDLMSNKSLQLNVVRLPDPRCLEDMREPAQLAQITQTYKNYLTPKFV